MGAIYLVTTGSYDDYTIVGAFSTEEKADEFVNGCDEYVVEEFPIDAECGKRATKLYCVNMFFDTGEFQPYSHGSDHWETEAVLPAGTRECVFPYPSNKLWRNGAMVPGITVQSPVSADHAKEAAIEARREWLREKGGA